MRPVAPPAEPIEVVAATAYHRPATIVVLDLMALTHNSTVLVVELAAGELDSAALVVDLAAQGGDKTAHHMLLNLRLDLQRG
ncbi:hypothetical protein GQ55_2G154900 [Panicum hallii var. hallii]|uniref:Uncharacterized protein n=1 Tax=Panicum hallii var. hallii TaxID=1504633 RepID=A0A2T7EPV4_9POAL|nr:hypothetical protein GQ55_2G154900 [Panicum hallii var. hallii]